MTLGSGRLSMGLQNMDPFLRMKVHDLSILSARSIELMLFGYSRKRLRNWKGDSSSGSFQPSLGSASHLASVLWNYPSRDSIVKDIKIRPDAAVILKNKILWGYEGLCHRGVESTTNIILKTVEECTPWINRISSRDHAWFEEKLLENISNGQALLRHIISRKSGYIDNWLKSLS